MWNREYYYNNQDKFRGYRKKYYEKNKKNIIYFIFDDKGEVKYIGSTVNIFRLNYHINHFSHIDVSENDTIKHFVLDKNITREELYYIEYYLINKCKHLENYAYKDISTFDFAKKRKEQLIKLAENLKFNDFKK